MFDWLRGWILRLLRVPPEPHAPAGAPGSLRAFRAGKNFYRLRVLAWAATQLATLVGIFFSLQFLRWLDADITAARAQQAQTPPAAVQPAEGQGEPESPPADRPTRRRGNGRPNFGGLVARVAGFPPWTFMLVKLAEGVAVVGFVILIPATFAAVRLDYDYRWYLVTDRSLRIRTGIWKLKESTMSFANLQQVEVSQGPLQRLLGIADVRVTSAGGGGGNGDRSGQSHDSMHEAVFHGVDNAFELRDLILDRLRRYREAGLGDPDERTAIVSVMDTKGRSQGDALAAAKEMLTEARALRAVLSIAGRD